MFSKKVILLMLIIAILVSCFVGCSDKEPSEFDIKNQKPSANLDILTSNRWEYDFESCAYILYMDKDGSFINYCACGNPAGYSDLIEYYIYNDENKTIYLYGPDKKYVGKGSITEISKDKVIIKKYGEVCEYVSTDEYVD